MTSIMIMISYKKIDLLKLKVVNKKLYLDEEILTIKSPIINYEFIEDKLHLKINGDADTHSIFLNLCAYIERLFKIQDVKTGIINNNAIMVNTDNTSTFYDSNKEEISKISIRNGGKAVCSLSCENGELFLKELLLTASK
jgi:hypothetical protein